MSRRITESDVAVIKGMLRRGDDQMSIGLWFGVNQARISEVKFDRKRKWRHVAPAVGEAMLPPKPPYCVVPQIVVDRGKAYEETVAELLALVDRLKERASRVDKATIN